MPLQEQHIITFPVGNLHGLVFWVDLSGLWLRWPFLYMLIKKGDRMVETRFKIVGYAILAIILGAVGVLIAPYVPLSRETVFRIC